jgi:hypothetical protein
MDKALKKMEGKPPQNGGNRKRVAYANQIFSPWLANAPTAMGSGPFDLLKYALSHSVQGIKFLKEYYDLRCYRELHQVQVYRLR